MRMMMPLSHLPFLYPQVQHHRTPPNLHLHPPQPQTRAYLEHQLQVGPHLSGHRQQHLWQSQVNKRWRRSRIRRSRPHEHINLCLPFKRESRDLKQFTFVKVTATITYEVAWIDNGVHHPQPRSQTSLLPVPTERERERPWLGLVTWFQNKINSEGRSPLSLSFFCLVRFHRSHNDRKGKIALLSLQL